MLKKSFSETLIHDMLKEGKSQIYKMSKKVVIPIALGVLLVAAASGYLLVLLRNRNALKGSPLVGSLITKETATADLEYNDSSGFYFKYPKSTKAQDITPSDDTYYSKISLTKGDSSLAVTVKDESSQTIDDLIKGDEYYKNASLLGATTLSGLKAMQYSVGGKFVTLALDSGVLYSIEGPKDGGFWESTQNIVVSTFNLGEKSNTEASDNAVYEPEEVVE